MPKERAGREAVSLTSLWSYATFCASSWATIARKYAASRTERDFTQGFDTHDGRRWSGRTNGSTAPWFVLWDPARKPVI